MMHTTHTRTIAAATACLAITQATAGLAFSDARRFYGLSPAGNTAISDTVETIGQLNLDLQCTASNPAGTTNVKLNHESVINSTTYKTASEFSIVASETSPRAPQTGALMINSAIMTLSHQSSIRFNYDINQNRPKGFFSLLVQDQSDQTLINFTTLTPQHGTFQLDLNPGTYSILEFSSITGLSTNESGLWTLSSTLHITSVPTPTPTAALTTPLILTRRRR